MFDVATPIRLQIKNSWLCIYFRKCLNLENPEEREGEIPLSSHESSLGNFFTSFGEYFYPLGIGLNFGWVANLLFPGRDYPQGDIYYEKGSAMRRLLS